MRWKIIFFVRIPSNWQIREQEYPCLDQRKPKNWAKQSAPRETIHLEVDRRATDTHKNRMTDRDGN